LNINKAIVIQPFPGYGLFGYHHPRLCRRSLKLNRHEVIKLTVNKVFMEFSGWKYLNNLVQNIYSSLILKSKK